VAAIAAAAFCLVALASRHFAVAVMATAISGACLGFLAFNFPPASIFLGDAGSTLLGLLLGAIAIAASRGAPPLLQAWIAALPLAVPVWDIVLVHLRRWQGGTRNLRALLESTGLDHLPHRLQQAGLRPRQVALTVYLMALLLAVMAILIVRYEFAALVLAIMIVVTGLIVGERPFGAFVARVSGASYAPRKRSESLPAPAEAATREYVQPAAQASPEVGR